MESELEETAIFAVHFAQVAELVDALVSNTNGANRAGSIPALGTKKTSEIWSFLYLAKLFKKFKLEWRNKKNMTKPTSEWL